MKAITLLLATFLLPMPAMADPPIHDPQIWDELNQVYANYRAMNPDELTSIRMSRYSEEALPLNLRSDVNTAAIASAYISECKNYHTKQSVSAARALVLSIDGEFKRYPPWHREKIIPAYFFSINTFMDVADKNPDKYCKDWSKKFG